MNYTSMTDFSRVTTETSNVTIKCEPHGTARIVVLTVLLGLITLITIIGNCFVFAAIILEPKLRNVSNFLICSLAVADLTVSTLVMPVRVITDICQYWFMGQLMCDIFLTLDVFTCTSSILNLVAISFDRYWAVTDLRYIRTRSKSRIFIMITLSWTIAFVIAIAPLLGWRSARELEDVDHTGQCQLTKDLGFTLFSTLGAFYVPCLVMMIMYGRIYKVARARIKKKNLLKQQSDQKQKQTLKVQTTKNGNIQLNVSTTAISYSPEVSELTHAEITELHDELASSADCDDEQFSKLREREKEKEKIVRMEKRKRTSLQRKREKKAARTLSIITGCFIGCWLPFFCMALIVPFCKACETKELGLYIVPALTWLGYMNSALNPAIYTIFNIDFRHAFKKILFGHYRERPYRPSRRSVRRPRRSPMPSPYLMPKVVTFENDPSESAIYTNTTTL